MRSASSPGSRPMHPCASADRCEQGAGRASARSASTDFEASIERKIDFVVPFDLKAAVNAAKLGQTFVDANRSSKAAAAIRDIATAVIGAGEAGGESFPDASGKSLLGKFDIKSMLAKKRSGPAVGHMNPRMTQSGDRAAHRVSPIRRLKNLSSKGEATTCSHCSYCCWQVGLATSSRLSIARSPDLRPPRRAPGGCRPCATVIPKARRTRLNRSSRRRSPRASPRLHRVAGSSSRIEALALRLHRIGKKLDDRTVYLHFDRSRPRDCGAAVPQDGRRFAGAWDRRSVRRGPPAYGSQLPHQTPDESPSPPSFPTRSNCWCAACAPACR